MVNWTNTADTRLSAGAAAQANANWAYQPTTSTSFSLGQLIK